jgi:hypothetical protein
MALSHQHEDRTAHQSGAKDWARRWIGTASYVALAVLAFLILRDHAAHLLSAVPYLLLLACPLMHIFMHGGHGHDHHHGEERKE